MVFISNFSTMLKYDQSAKYINKIKFRALFDKWVCEMLWRSRVNTKHQIWQELKHPAANFSGLQAALQSTFTVQYIFLYLPYFSHIHLQWYTVYDVSNKQCQECELKSDVDFVLKVKTLINIIMFLTPPKKSSNSQLFHEHTQYTYTVCILKGPII